MPNRPTRANSPYRGQAEELSARLRGRRLEYGLSQEAVAREAGTSTATVRAIEANRVVEPGFFTIAALASVLGLNLRDLAGKSLRRSSRSTGRGKSPSSGQ